MANETSTPTWRNALSWAAISFVVYSLFAAGFVSLLKDGGLGAVLKSNSTIAIIAVSLLFSVLVVGFTQRNLPISPKSLRSFLILTVLAIAAFALIGGGLHALAGRISLSTMSVSAKAALFLGLTLLALAIVGFLTVVVAHAGALAGEQGEAIVERGRSLLYSYIAMTAMAAMLMLLSLAGPGGVLPSNVALAGVIVLLVIMTVLPRLIWPMLDELSQTLSRETGHLAFYLIAMIGGSWAILAHLGFVPAPAPIDWLTMLTLTVFVASFIAVGRRGLLTSR